MTSIPSEPVRTAPQYLPVLTTLNRMMPARRDQKINEAGALFQRDHATYLLERLPNINLKDASAIDELLPWSDPVQARCRVPAKPTRSA
jgi:hypothetical protein